MLNEAEQPAEPDGHEPTAPQEGRRGSTVEQLERRVATLEREHKEWVACFDHGLGEVEEELRTLERRLGFRRGSDGKLVSDYASPPRVHPALVTVEPWPDDGEVFGEAHARGGRVATGLARAGAAALTPWPGSGRPSGCFAWRSS